MRRHMKTSAAGLSLSDGGAGALARCRVSEGTAAVDLYAVRRHWGKPTTRGLRTDRHCAAGSTINLRGTSVPFDSQEES